MPQISTDLKRRFFFVGSVQACQSKLAKPLMQKIFFIFIFGLFSFTDLSSQKKAETAELKILPAQDSLMIGLDNLIIIFKPLIKKSDQIIFDVDGKMVLASDVKGKPNYFRVRTSSSDSVNIAIYKKGKIIYTKKFKPCAVPKDNASIDRFKTKEEEIQRLLK
jgi:hypothetical protein